MGEFEVAIGDRFKLFTWTVPSFPLMEADGD